MILNGFSVAFSELLANIIVGTFLAELGLKVTLIGSYLVGALSSILYLFPVLTFGLWYATILFFLKLGLVGSFAATFYGTNALFRVDLVPLIFALANIFSRLWTALTPQISQGKGDTVTFSVIFSLCLLGMLGSNFISNDIMKKKKKKKRSSKDKKRKHRRR